MPSTTSDQSPVDRYKLLFRLHILAAIGALLILLYSLCFGGALEVLRIVGVGMLVAGAALTSGFLSGFIFGIPRVGSERASAKAEAEPGGGRAVTSEAQANAVTPNSNLVEISDWLTKIMVGVGLVELNSIPGKLWKLSNYLGPGLRPAHCDTSGSCADYVNSGQVAGLAIIIFYFTLGFLLGYVWTRLYFQRDLGGLVEDLQKEKAIASGILLAEASMSQGQIKEAMKSVDRSLEIDPLDGRLVLTKARALKRQAMKAGNDEDKKKLLNDALVCAKQAATLLPGWAEPLYNQACYQALLGLSKSEILNSLRAAFLVDPSLRQLATQDSDLDSLREDDDFKRLIGESRATGV